MSSALADAGVKAVSEGKYGDGIEKLTEAIKSRAAPLWHLERSKAYLRTNQFDLALHDAEMALRIGYDRSNRDYMMEAQLRRAITLFRMGRFADADVCAFWAIRLCDGARAMEDDGQQNKVDNNGDYNVHVKEVSDEAKPGKSDGLATAMKAAGKRTKDESLRNQAFTWRIQALTKMEQLPPGHVGRKVSVSTKYPKYSEVPTAKAIQKPTATANSGVSSGGDAASAPNATTNHGAWEKLWNQYHTMYMKQKIRCSFYQTDSNLTVDIFVKNLSNELLAVDSEPGSITLSPTQGSSLGGFEGPIVLFLFSEIKPEATKYTVKSMKIELVLQKQTPGKWPALRRDGAEIIDNLSLNPSQGAPFYQFYDFVSTLGYKNIEELQLPDFDKNPSNWYAALTGNLRTRFNKNPNHSTSSALETQVNESFQSEGDAMKIDGPAEKIAPLPARENKATNAASGTPAYPTSSKKGPKNWDNIDEGDDEELAKDGDVNSFFQTIYKNADEDTKRAMMKSYVESNGTALSTSWSEAKAKTYESQPPDGAEAKKWE